MKQAIIMLLIATNSFLFSTAQSAPKPLKKVLELKIAGAQGANGASVAWHPGQKKYYAAMAGNVEYCIGVYDASGRLLSKPEQQTLFDIRGLWYNTNTKTLQMNGYKDFGWGEYKLDAKGIPSSVQKLHEDMNQPADQSAGAFNAKGKVVYFFNEDGNIDKYNYETAELDDNIELHLGQTEDDANEYEDNYDVIDQYNATTVIYTGIPKAELGLLNVDENRIELYDIKTGYLTKSLVLPDDAPLNASLNFSFCNGIYWLFDKDARTWMGYK
jgi:hypothetical protein